ncbi:oocyte zinc finger protein XlCOF6-like [Plutella xylostella]|uniref:oocyte zinc finger protein XlCOF6-like n=1 Tax=Plutella xylostella TaxID=51655 RepID=UPI002032820A|nr:oocyte zinc finger protein XlCOF6-like [Plutella xylostella]
MGFGNVCIACLATDVKMYNLNKLFRSVYSNLTGITSIDDTYYICYVCTHVLLKIEQFRSLCLRAYETLTRTEHAHDRTTWHHEPRLKLTETKVLYFGPDQIVLSDTDADDNDVKEAKLFHSGLIHAIKCDTKAQVHTYDTVLKSERNNIHSNPLNIKPGAVFIEPGIRELKEEFESDFNHSELADRFACDIQTQESQDTVNIEDKTKLKSVKKEGKSKPARKIQIKVSQKKNLNKKTLFSNKQISETMTIAVQSPVDAKREIEMRRQSHKYDTSNFKCNLCFKVFNHQRTLSNHMKKHNNDFVHECDYCHIKAKTRIMMKEHILRTHMYKFTCKRCPYVCSARVQAKSHIKQHKGVTLVCKICEKTFRFSHTLAVHMRSSHISELSEVVCEMCGDVFISKNGLNGHMSLSHSFESLPRSGPACTPCGARFCSDAAYRRHLVLSTKHHVSNGCSRCGDTFQNDKALRKHVKEAHPESTDRPPRSLLRMPIEWPVPCPECSVVQNDRVEYKQHILAVHPDSARAKKIQYNDKRLAAKKFVCEVCGLGFPLACYLSYHMCTHTGHRPHACDHCSLSFASPAELRVHERVHQPRQACPDCGRSFKHSYTLKKHRRVVHLKILPHNCSQCDKKFHDRCALKYHMRHVHEKVPWPTINRKTRLPRKDGGKRPRREYHDSGDSSTN